MGTDINTYYKTTGEAQWNKFKSMLKDDEIDMVKEDLIKIINEEIDKKFRQIAELKDVPVALQSEVKSLLDKEVINGGTSKAINPNDINMPYEVLRGNIISKRYTDGEIKELKEQIDILARKIESIKAPEIQELKVEDIIKEIQRRLAE